MAWSTLPTISSGETDSGTNYQLFNEVSGVTPGTVTADDYTAWRARFGKTLGRDAGSELDSSAVPEPATLAYAAACIACVFAVGATTTGQITRSRHS